MRLQRSEEALIFFRRAYERLKKTDKPPNLQLAESRRDICEALHSLGQDAEALLFAFEALRCQEQVAGADHPSCVEPRLLVGSLAYHTSDFPLAEDLLRRAIAQLMFSEAAQACLPLPLCYYQGLHALALSKLGRAEAAREQAEIALKGDHSQDRLSCRHVDGFMDVFGHLVLQEEASKSGDGDTLLLSSSTDRTLTATLELGDNCMNNPSQQRPGGLGAPLCAATESQASEDPGYSQLANDGTKEASSLLGAATLKIERQHSRPKPKPKPAHLQHRPAISNQ